MYNIPHFKASNHQQVLDFMQANPFVTICGVDSKGLPVATHIPVLMKVENDIITISGHIMRKQDHSTAFEVNKNVLVIFSAPSAFVSANWYTTKNMGSTWNYQTVHARGQLEIKDETHLRNLLTELTLYFEDVGSVSFIQSNLSKSALLSSNPSEINVLCVFCVRIVIFLTSILQSSLYTNT